DHLRLPRPEVDGPVERPRWMFGAPMDAVEVVEVRERLRVRQVVDADELEVLDLALRHRPDDATTDATEPIDGDLRGHFLLFSSASRTQNLVARSLSSKVGKRQTAED